MKAQSNPYPMLRCACDHWQRWAAALPPASRAHFLWLARRLVHNWQLPEMLAAAALVTALLEAGADEAVLAADFTPPTMQLAHRFRAWRLAHPDCHATPSIRCRRELYYIAHTADGLPLLCLLLADLDVRLLAADPAPAVAQEALEVFVHLAEMLGVWHLRRRWIEAAMRLLDPAAYDQQAQDLDALPQLQRLLSAGPPTDGLETRMMTRQERWLADNGAGHHLTPWPGVEPSSAFDKRLLAFARLREALLSMPGGGLAPLNVELVPLLPGSLLYDRRTRSPSTDDPPTPPLSVRITCATEADCYRALGIVHRLGSPARADHNARLRNFIADPRPNGYRALHTECLWPRRPSGSHSERQWPVQFRILTPEMHGLNEWGVLADLYRGDDHPDAHPWWRRLEDNSRQLAKALKRPADISTYLHDHGLDTTSDPIYCFTPLGDLYLMERGSTALDFAFRIHTELGRHAAGIEVNGRPVALDHELHNGDLVRVIYTPWVSQLDFTWQGLVHTKRARFSIRAHLRRVARDIHPGRAAFEDQLIEQSDAYRRERWTLRGRPAYTVPLPTSRQIEEYLERAARRLRLPGLADLYQRLADESHTSPNPSELRGRPLAQHLAFLLISEHIVPAIKLPSDIPLTEFSRIELCPQCRPTPQDEFIDTRNIGSPDAPDIVIHHPDCVVRRGLQLIATAWLDATPSHWLRYRLELKTDDQHRLLDRVLEMAYQIHGVYLYSVEATVVDRLATVKLEVGVKLPQLCRDLRDSLETLDRHARAYYHPSPVDQGWRASIPAALSNPYTEDVVIDDRFFGRDEITESVLGWLHRSELSPLLLLHGQRRVGKSAFVQRLLAQPYLSELTPPTVAVLADFRTVAVQTPETVAGHLARRVCRAVGLSLPPRGAGQDPLDWLDAVLDDALAHLAGRRLLIIIDEFDAELTLAPPPAHLPAIAALRSIMAHPRPINWLLIVQSAFLADARFRRAFPDVPYAVPRVTIGYLPETFARQLIRQPAEQRGYHYVSADPAVAQGQSVVTAIYAASGGSPYLIHIICRLLIDHVDRYGSRRITHDDLNLITGQILSRPGLLDHFTEHLSSAPRRAIAHYLAHRLPPGGRIPLAELETALLALPRAPSPATLRRHLDFLEQVGVIDRQTQGPLYTVGIPVQLLHRLLIQSLL